MSTSVSLSLGEGARLEWVGEEARLQGPWGGLSLRKPTPRLQEALRALEEGATEDALVALAGPEAALLFFHLESAAGLGLLRWTVLHQARKLATMAPHSVPFVRRPAGLDPARRYRLSRFAYCRGTEHGAVVVECPLSLASVELQDERAAALFHVLARGGTPRELEARTPEGLAPGAARAVTQLFTEAGMLTAEPEEHPATPSEVALRQWEFHDLLFHARSRGTRYGHRSGATYRFEGRIPPLPAVKPPMSQQTVELFQPEPGSLGANEPLFSQVLERRRTLYSRGPARLTAAQLGEFLFRCARVRRVQPSPVGEVSERPYPGAGARYELELYPVVHDCDGVPAGLYHYCPLRHRLEHLSQETQEVLALLEAGRAPAPHSTLPDVLFVIAARFPRMSWKYESIAYSLILKDVGVLFQTMYLVAAAMSLSPYALGRGDPDLFCRVAGTDAFEESSVGEFALSGPPA